MLKGISHTGIAVKNLDESIKAYQVLGAEMGEIHDAPESGMRAAMISAGGSTLELIEPTGEGTIKKFIESRGEGIHHLCIEVDDIVKTLAELEAKGIRLIDKVPRQGIEGKVAFIHPKSMNGVLIELLEK
ncbi:MAG: methylmalonyl-CoA epimerase [Dehalococcoidales bacterium]|nr:methylmalonyl-CoA epimerase [Dehalococcoidales bacterium]